MGRKNSSLPKNEIDKIEKLQELKCLIFNWLSGMASRETEFIWIAPNGVWVDVYKDSVPYSEKWDNGRFTFTIEELGECFCGNKERDLLEYMNEQLEQYGGK